MSKPLLNNQIMKPRSLRVFQPITAFLFQGLMLPRTHTGLVRFQFSEIIGNPKREGGKALLASPEPKYDMNLKESGLQSLKSTWVLTPSFVGEIPSSESGRTAFPILGKRAREGMSPDVSKQLDQTHRERSSGLGYDYEISGL